MKIRELSLLLFPLLLAVSCKQDDINVYRVAKQGPLPSAAGDMPAQMINLMESGAQTLGAGTVTWTKPAEWTEEAVSGGLRKATFKTGKNGAGAEVSIISLAGSAGGDLSNVNRWRGQIGLADIDQAALDKSSERVLSPVGELLVVDFTGEGQARSRLVAARLAVGAETWFFKMVGTEKDVGTAKGRFIAFLKGLKKGA
jgi:hypothetical protein